MRKQSAAPPLHIRRLRRSELPAGTMELARYLIGKTLVHDLPRVRVAGRIVETEAYPSATRQGTRLRALRPADARSSSARSRLCVFHLWLLLHDERFQRGGGHWRGVLVRAVEPLEGIRFMQWRRGTTRLQDLTRGPGRLAQAMDINNRYDGLNLCAGGKLWLGAAVRPTGPIGATIRIGITRDVHRLYRFTNVAVLLSAARRACESDLSGAGSACGPFSLCPLLSPRPLC